MGKPRGQKKRECYQFKNGTFLTRRIEKKRKVGRKWLYTIVWDSGEITEEPEEHIIDDTVLLANYEKIKKYNADIVNYAQANHIQISTKEATIYNRVSSVNNISISTQEKENVKYCRRNGIKISEIVNDDGISGRNMKNMKNGNLGSSLKYLTEDDYDSCIVLYSIDRLSRHTLYGLKFLNDCKNQNIDVHFTMENSVWDKHTSGYTKKNITDGLNQAQLFSDQTSEKIINTNSRLRAEGHELGPAPYGKKIIRDVDDIRKKVICDKENKIKNYIFKEYKKHHLITKMSKKCTFAHIASELKRKNMTKRDKEWSNLMIKNLIIYILKEQREQSDFNLNNLVL